MTYKEVKIIFLPRKPHHIVITILLSFLSITSIAIHINDIHSIISNGELIALINIALSPPNIIIIFYWVIVIVVFFTIQSLWYTYINRLKPILKRKLFHFLITILYIPAIKYMNRDLLITLSLIMLYMFILIEMIRTIKILPMQNTSMIKAINAYLIENIDDRDDNKFILTHIFLLTGIISSLFYTFNKQYEQDYSFISLIVLGIGDSFCSIFGVLLGRTKIYPQTNRTLEGTIGGLITSIGLFIAITQRRLMISELIGFALIFIYEGITLEIDNLVLPMFANLLFVYISYMN